MAAQKFPSYVYNQEGKERFVKNDVELMKAKQDGFNSKYVHSHFPKWLYSAKGESVLVNDVAECEAKIAEGYGEDFVAAPILEPAKEQQSGGSDSGLVRALLEENRDLNRKVEGLEAAVDGITEEIEALKAQISKSLE